MTFWSKDKHGGKDHPISRLKCASCGDRIRTVRNAIPVERTHGQGDAHIYIVCPNCGPDEGRMNHWGPHIVRDTR